MFKTRFGVRLDVLLAEGTARVLADGERRCRGARLDESFGSIPHLAPCLTARSRQELRRQRSLAQRFQRQTRCSELVRDLSELGHCREAKGSLECLKVCHDHVVAACL